LVTLEQLKEDFAVTNVAPYGDCLVIPASMFGPAWEEDLKNEGCKIFSGSSEGKAAFFVKVPVEEAKAERTRTVYAPPPSEKNVSEKQRKTPLGVTWTDQENKCLIELVGQKLSPDEIAKHLPGRTEIAVRLRIGRLEKHGLLKKHQRKYTHKEKVAAPPPTPLPIEPNNCNKTGAIIGTLSKEEIESIVVDAESKEVRRKFIPWLKYADKPLTVSEPFEEA
jgi:hypothetical protein